MQFPMETNKHTMCSFITLNIRIIFFPLAYSIQIQVYESSRVSYTMSDESNDWVAMLGVTLLNIILSNWSHIA